eukprot:1144763-Pelagomonas_calceolata.AAC.1
MRTQKCKVRGMKRAQNHKGRSIRQDKGEGRVQAQIGLMNARFGPCRRERKGASAGIQGPMNASLLVKERQRRGANAGASRARCVPSTFKKKEEYAKQGPAKCAWACHKMAKDEQEAVQDVRETCSGSGSTMRMQQRNGDARVIVALQERSTEEWSCTSIAGPPVRQHRALKVHSTDLCFCMRFAWSRACQCSMSNVNACQPNAGEHAPGTTPHTAWLRILS